MKAVYTRLQRGLEILLVDEVRRGSGGLRVSPMAELLREGCAFEDVWNPQLRDYSDAGKSWLPSTRAPNAGLDFGACPVACSTISSMLVEFVQQLQPTKG